METGPDVKNLLRKLLKGYMQYFDNDYMNSEGRKVFEEMARMLIYEHPEIKPTIRRIRRNPTLDNVLKLARRILGSEADKIVKTVGKYPYVYRFERDFLEV